MAKTVFMFPNSTPEQRGWNDKVEVWEDGKKLWEGRGSVNPSKLAYPEYYAAANRGENPRKEDYSWDKQGGWIDYGKYKYNVSSDYNGSLLLNDGGWVDSRIPNKRHDYEKKMNGVYVHEGYPYVRRAGYPVDEDTERGSTGCPTIHPDDLEGFRSNFNKDDKGELIILHPPASQGMGDLKPAEGRQDEKAINYIEDIVYPWG
jgi:hypothetical protein